MTRHITALALLLLAAPALAQGPAEVWMSQYNGPANHQDEPFRLAMGAGGLFVAGRSYSPTTFDDFTLLKYSSQGALAWARQYDGAGDAADIASDLLPDGQGGAFLCGYSHAGASWEAVLLHYDRSGNLLWTRSVPTPGFVMSDFGPRLARTPDGGLRMGVMASGNFLVAAFDGQGAPLWTREVDIVANEMDVVTGIGVDSAGNTIVAGPAGGGFGGFETVMLDTLGSVVWTDNEFGNFGSTLGRAFVAVDANDEVVVTGVPESNCGLFQVRTWRLTPEGDRLWTRTFPPQACDSADAVDMELDRDGNALVLCQSMINGDGGWHNFTTLKYDPAGNEVWQRTLANDGVDIPTALDIDPAGNVYITGAAGFDNNTYNGMAASYARDGSLRWTKFFDSGAPNDRPADIVAGQRGDVYLSGAGYFQATNDDILTVKLQQAPQTAGRR